ncbi:MAG: sulfatase-like hydrolase/transferase [Solirubrobacterales bacterium]|nr:sulfatase-like hydrolase/transferase [Solirubrobacterales bacterium]
MPIADGRRPRRQRAARLAGRGVSPGQEAGRGEEAGARPCPTAGRASSRAWIGKSYKDSKEDFLETRRAPVGAPNVLVVLLDALGFGHTSTFGGPVPTPMLDRLARNGLQYTCWHTTALCSPTRAALLTGQCGHGGQEDQDRFHLLHGPPRHACEMRSIEAIIVPDVIAGTRSTSPSHHHRTPLYGPSPSRRVYQIRPGGGL